AHQLVGSARLELAARSTDGFDQRLAQEVALLPGVEHSAAVLRENVAIRGPRGRTSVQLIGVTPGLVTLGRLGTRNFGRGGSGFSAGRALPRSVAGAVGGTPGHPLTVLAAGGAHETLLGAELDGEIVGAAASSPIAIALLPVAQTLTGKAGRVTQIFVQPRA